MAGNTINSNNVNNNNVARTLETNEAPVKTVVGQTAKQTPVENGQTVTQPDFFESAQLTQANLQNAVPQATAFNYNQIQGVANNPNVTPEFIRGVEAMAQRLGARPEHIMAAMSFETGGTFSPSIQNGIGATGLIQFLPSTARGLGTTTDQLKNMSAVEQLQYVEKYFEPFKGRLNSLEAVYTAILSGSPKQPDDVLFRRGTRAYDQNPLDWNRDGQITAAEATTIVGARQFGGVRAVQQRLVDLGFVPKEQQANFADGRWGTNTSNALADFQRSRNLPQTGLMNEATGYALFGGAPPVPTPPTPPTNPGDTGGTGRPSVPTAVNLERGNTGDQVKTLQDALVRLGHMSQEQVNTGYGTFGPKTEAAVEAFQQRNNLPVTGKFDAVTQDAMNDIFNGVGRTNQNPAVTRALQDQLVARGYMTRAQVNTGYGTFGPQTEAAVKRFQQDNSIQQTGKLGPQTYNSLFGSTAPTGGTGGTTSPNGRPTVSRGFSEFNDPASNHYNVDVSGVGRIRVTEGFLVNGPHSPKNNVRAILSNGELHRVPNGSRVNLGIDYVVSDPQNRVKNWFGGTVSDTIRSNTGYGNRVIVQTDQTFNYNGRNYPVFAHYAHLDSIGVTRGQQINAGDSVGIMGNTGGSHGAHVDFRTWIDTPDGRIDISPNLLVNRQ